MNEVRAFIVWADPGLMTGLAWYDLDTGDFQSGQYGPNDLRRKLEELRAAHGLRMIIGYERFNAVGGPKTSTPEHSHRAIQLLDSFAAEYTIPLTKPQPSSSRNLGSVVFLRRLGWHKPGRGHANDAAQHLLADLLKRRPMPGSIREKLFPGYKPSATIAP